MEDLPELQGDEIPSIVKSLIHALLAKKPSNRLSADEAASICQVLLWAPKSWTALDDFMPRSQEILQWTMAMATKVIYEYKFSNSAGARAEYELVLTFLSRLTIDGIKRTLSWIKSR